LPKQVLIVDDHEAFRRTMRFRLQGSSDLTVCGEAADGVDAVEKAQKLSPDIIIMDFAMPNMNGLEAAAALKLMMPGVQIFLLTAHGSRELEVAARDIGVSAVFSKYDDLAPLFKRINAESGLASIRRR
jgi:two-component system, NarL family, response regulator NreC